MSIVQQRRDSLQLAGLIGLRLQVVWTQGATQQGSSGAPLIDVASRKLVGILTGGDYHLWVV